MSLEARWAANSADFMVYLVLVLVVVVVVVVGATCRCVGGSFLMLSVMFHEKRSLDNLPR